MQLLDGSQRQRLYEVAQALDANAGRIGRGERPSAREIAQAELVMEQVVRSIENDAYPPGLVTAMNAVSVAAHMGRAGDMADAAVFASGARALYALLAQG
jgi:hypothetical protein